MPTEVFSEDVANTGEERITISALRDGEFGVVCVSIRRGGFAATFTVNVGVARRMAGRINDAAAAAADPSR